MLGLQSFARSFANTGFDILTLDPNGSKSSFSGSVLVRSLFWGGIVNAERLFNAAFELHKSVLTVTIQSGHLKPKEKKIHAMFF